MAALQLLTSYQRRKRWEAELFGRAAGKQMVAEMARVGLIQRVKQNTANLSSLSALGFGER